MRLPKGYKVVLINPKRGVIGVVDIGEYDLEKQIARGDVINQIQEIAEKEVRDENKRGVDQVPKEV